MQAYAASHDVGPVDLASLAGCRRGAPRAGGYGARQPPARQRSTASARVAGDAAPRGAAPDSGVDARAGAAAHCFQLVMASRRLHLRGFAVLTAVFTQDPNAHTRQLVPATSTSRDDKIHGRCDWRRQANAAA